MLRKCALGLTYVIASGAGGAVIVQQIPSFSGQALNANGTVAAGYVGLGGGLDYQAIRWTQWGGAQNIGATLPEGADSLGSAMSDDGSLMVGYSEPPIMQAFWWTAASGLVRIGNFAGFPGSMSMAHGVSGDGKVVIGEGYTDNWMAFRWTQAEGMFALGRLPGASSSSANATSIDGRIIVGRSGSVAYRWTSTEGMQPLPPLEGANGISSDGSAVLGWIGNDGACLVRGGLLRVLGTLPGATNVSPRQISGDGSLVVGSWFKPGEPDIYNRYRTFLWTARGGLLDLSSYFASEGFDTTGWTFSSMPSVSRDGRVLMGLGRRNNVGVTWRATIPAPCTSDLTNDGVVDDADFGQFAVAYDLLDCADTAMPLWCPADLNLDSVVDDTDFVMFASAYDVLMCP